MQGRPEKIHHQCCGSGRRGGYSGLCVPLPDKPRTHSGVTTCERRVDATPRHACRAPLPPAPPPTTRRDCSATHGWNHDRPRHIHPPAEPGGAATLPGRCRYRHHRPSLSPARHKVGCMSMHQPNCVPTLARPRPNLTSPDTPAPQFHRVGYSHHQPRSKTRLGARGSRNNR